MCPAHRQRACPLMPAHAPAGQLEVPAWGAGGRIPCGLGASPSATIHQHCHRHSDLLRESQYLRATCRCRPAATRTGGWGWLVHLDWPVDAAEHHWRLPLHWLHSGANVRALLGACPCLALLASRRGGRLCFPSLLLTAADPGCACLPGALFCTWLAGWLAADLERLVCRWHEGNP